jgi:hypothetical protein
VRPEPAVVFSGLSTAAQSKAPIDPCWPLSKRQLSAALKSHGRCERGDYQINCEHHNNTLQMTSENCGGRYGKDCSEGKDKQDAEDHQTRADEAQERGQERHASHNRPPRITCGQEAGTQAGG